MLKVKKLHPDAKLPTVANPGEDLGYDLYALEDIVLEPGIQTVVRTGIAASATLLTNGVFDILIEKPAGLLIRDRSSMATKGITVSGGVIDAGYRGELAVILTANHNVRQIADDSVCACGAPKNNHPYRHPFTASHYSGYRIKAGDKIAQMIPIPVLTADVIEVEDLPGSTRGEKGFGSSGR